MAHPSKFTLRPEHIALLRRAYVGWQDCETGAPEIDPKRPYGNSDVARDVAEILGIDLRRNADGDADEERERELLALHAETATALQIVLLTGSFEPGNFVRTHHYSLRSWARVVPPVPA